MHRRDFVISAVALAVCMQSAKEVEAVAVRESRPGSAQSSAGLDFLTDQDGNQITDDVSIVIVVEKFQ